MKPFASFKPHPGIYKKLPPSDMFAVIGLLGALCLLLFFLLLNLNDSLLHETTIRYGEINEGIVGVPVHKNPLYATDAAEKDIAALIHAGLLKRDNKGGLTPHLASEWTQESPNNYRFTLRKNAAFHDGTPVTTNDVLHTVAIIQQKQKYESPYRPIWSGVVAEAIDEYTLAITVPEGNLHFPEQFTTPILPEHIWKKIPADKQRNYNGSGIYIGAGPYKYSKETVTLDERPTSITLEGFSGYVLGYPFIRKITLHFFVDVKNLLKAYEVGVIDGIHGIAAAELPVLLKQRKDIQDTLHIADTNRVFGVFFNTEDGRILSDSFLRSVLSQWVKREQITTQVFNGHATAIQAPLATDTEVKEQDITIEALQQTLEDIGWKFESATGRRERDGVPLTISFVLPDIEETQQIAEVLTEGWRRLGVGVTMNTFTEKEATAAIAKKEFDVMLYGYEANNPKDLVALWKSGNEENLASVTGFGSPALNTFLTELEQPEPPKRLAELPHQPTTDNWRNIVYTDIKVEMMKSVPAIFLYAPHFLYVLPGSIKGVDLQKEKQRLGSVTNPSDRFVNVHKWHIKREKVWKPFVEN